MRYKYKVYLASEEYGSEEFVYDTDAEQREGVNRLITRAREEFRKDGVEREVRVVIDGKGEDGEGAELTAEDLAAELRILQRERSFGDEVESEDFRLMRERFMEEAEQWVKENHRKINGLIAN